MAYLRNAWYVAAWSNEIGDGLLSRTILGDSIVFFRDKQNDGRVIAARNLCPHRFAPLDRGKLIDARWSAPITDCGSTCEGNAFSIRMAMAGCRRAPS